MPKKLKIDKCPLGKVAPNKLKGKKCQKCEHYNPQQWFSAQGEVDVFCGAEQFDGEKEVMKHPKKAKDMKPHKEKKEKK